MSLLSGRLLSVFTSFCACSNNVFRSAMASPPYRRIGGLFIAAFKARWQKPGERQASCRDASQRDKGERISMPGIGRMLLTPKLTPVGGLELGEPHVALQPGAHPREID